MKQENNERVEVYYERLLKLANSLQHKTTNNFLIAVFKSRLQSYLCVTTSMEKKNSSTT
jgi:hypothetical protein